MPIDDHDIQQRCKAFLKEIGIPGFVLFGRLDDHGKCMVTYSVHKMPVKTALLGLLSAVTDLVKRAVK